MILSFSKRFVFVHIHKCAGESIERHCAPFLKPWDILLGPGRSGIAQVPSAVLKRTVGLRKHSPAIEIRRVLGPQRYQRLLSFSVVRHPEDRMVSLYRYLLRLARKAFALSGDETIEASLDAFWKSRGLTIEDARRLSRDQRRPHLRPVVPNGTVHEWPGIDALMSSRSLGDFILHPSTRQDPAFQSQFSRLVDPENGILLVDQVLRQDCLSSDWPELASRIGVPGPLPRHNSSHRVEKPDVSPEARLAIQQRFQDDFQEFGFDLRGD